MLRYVMGISIGVYNSRVYFPGAGCPLSSSHVLSLSLTQWRSTTYVVLRKYLGSVTSNWSTYNTGGRIVLDHGDNVASLITQGCRCKNLDLSLSYIYGSW